MTHNLLLPLRSQDIQCADRADWLDARRRLIGASESPAICGVGYANQNVWSIWHSKLATESLDDSDGDDSDDNDPDGDERFSASMLKKMDVGKRMEPVIRGLFADDTGIEMVPDIEHTIRVHPDYPFIGATLDGLAMHPERGLIVGELKNVSSMNADEWHGNECPLKYLVQVQQQLFVTGCEWGAVVALIGGESLAIRWVQRDEAFLAALLQKLQRFWMMVQTGIRPPLDGSAITGKILTRLHPDDNGQVVAMPDEALLWQIRRKEMKALKKFVEARIDDLNNHIKQALGDNTYGLLPDGSCFSWKTSERDGYVREVKASKSRTLREHKGLPRGVRYTPPAIMQDEPIISLFSDIH